MTTPHSEVRVIFGSFVRLAVALSAVGAAVYGSRIWEAPQLVRLEPYTVELNLLLPRLPLSYALRLLQLALGAGLLAILLLRRAQRRG